MDDTDEVLACCGGKDSSEGLEQDDDEKEGEARSACSMSRVVGRVAPVTYP